MLCKCKNYTKKTWRQGGTRTLFARKTKMETKKEYTPTTRSFLDTDMYKATMGQYVFHQHPNVEVVYRSKNRTKGILLAEVIDEGEFRHELDRIQDLRPTTEELDYMANRKINGNEFLFKDDYLAFLANIRLSDYKLLNEEGNYVIETKGLWKNDIYWETPALATKNSLYYRALGRMLTQEQRESIMIEGDRRLEEKIKILEQNPEVLFMEFGTRRRHSYEHQEKVMKKLMERVPGNMIGTSNVYLAMKLGLEPKGTMAHETFMVRAAMMADTDEGLRASHGMVLDEWYKEYGKGLSIFLTDTFGTEFFFEDMTQKQAEDGIGLRQDSGNPWAFKRRQIEFYEGRGIDPIQKAFVPSDGLDMGKLVSIHNADQNKIGQVGGVGTNLTNDFGEVPFLPGFKPLSLVMKAVEANGRPTVKLSDNPAKATGPAEEVARYQRVFGYDPTKYEFEECVY
jgi:nicotinate phosphoribosyltransferase